MSTKVVLSVQGEWQAVNQSVNQTERMYVLEIGNYTARIIENPSGGWDCDVILSVSAGIARGIGSIYRFAADPGGGNDGAVRWVYGVISRHSGFKVEQITTVRG
ncbi:hypothetical protein SEA_DAKITI_89 [Gordonia phage Dakiti]|uniref:Uncharacterized protein n=1 Tax=Gordonia phage Chelms TaxID=2588132 RepID=A0A4Y6EIK2_9CAUD|nr:hypothetical protein HWC24_gp041 [Gordonia phage Chelms]QDF18302.1 hypothetical protein SEA_CHELMS_88 [Gordonia phage Chelms]WIC40075.1 hypothetical protein SEA_DAKITI_89 [Gordonia phage Dakiti]